MQILTSYIKWKRTDYTETFERCVFHKHGFGSIKVGKKLNSRLNQKQFFVKLFNALVWWLAFVKKLFII